jgi:hypothetical protein
MVSTSRTAGGILLWWNEGHEGEHSRRLVLGAVHRQHCSRRYISISLTLLIMFHDDR